MKLETVLATERAIDPVRLAKTPEAGSGGDRDDRPHNDRLGQFGHLQRHLFKRGHYA